MLDHRLETNLPMSRFWEFQERRASGVFVTSRSGALLCRLEPPFTLWLWDKKAGCEIPIDVRELPLYPFAKGS